MNVRQQLRRHLPSKAMWSLTHMRLYWSAAGDHRANFGDQLSPLLIESLFGRRVKFSGIANADIVSTGSLIDALEAADNHMRPWIWGSGYIESGPRWQGPPVRLAAVRGALSQSRVEHLTGKSIALGDPAILVDVAYPALRDVPKRFDVSIVPHFIDADADAVRWVRDTHPEFHIINVLAPAHQVLAQIAESRVVLSSSLHGLICADALGVPNQWTPMSQNVTGGSYKFRDYYSAFDLEAHSLDVRVAADCADEFRRNWRRPIGFEARQRDLLRAFPGPAGRS